MWTDISGVLKVGYRVFAHGLAIERNPRDKHYQKTQLL